MFHLNLAISRWRSKLQASGIRSVDILDELESHLRDDIEQQVKQGVDEERAFEESVQRLGLPAVLKSEFARADLCAEPRRSVAHWLSAASTSLVAAIGVWTLVALPLTAGKRAMALCLILLMGFNAWSIPRVLAGVADARLRKAAAVVWGIACPVLWLFVFWVGGSRFPLSDGMFISLSLAVSLAVLLAILATLSADAEPGSVTAIVPWTPALQQTLETAQEEAANFGHDFVGTEHMLLGLLAGETGMVSQVLLRLGAKRDQVKQLVERIVGAGPELRGVRQSVAPCTPRLKRALALAAEEARALNEPEVRAEHILLGLLKEGSGVAALVLKELGIRVKSVRGQMLALREKK